MKMMGYWLLLAFCVCLFLKAISNFFEFFVVGVPFGITDLMKTPLIVLFGAGILFTWRKLIGRIAM